ncbi:RNA polymerase sigma factor [Aminobacter ciceronei]|uniref:RNA polymerase sigma-70 factor (ECF subfamily) n=1 Tax=Aminobacter ciceronei TaxID=150723 RepID=A0ABR6C8K2_9HYPH|nr:RNA polymerase sigma factor [Aminobacter ciceronei]MBA8907555.1 RNA polymerase sigma-70 factor (ECF subfamily) [Aminobacter ciceronei]MBA9021344.1 RNA polymerase sigma-70 factor (ECF subfamily) [Aminobacter ciceronei]
MTQEPHSHVPPLRLVAGTQHRGLAHRDDGQSIGRKGPAISDIDWTILMARSQDGDSAAYLRLLEEVTPYLRSLASRLLRNRQDMEDAVQDALLTLHSIRHTYDPTRPFGPWLVAIAHRRFVDRLRRQGRVRARETPLTPEHETFAEPQSNLDERPDRHGLHGAIDNLPPLQRQAIRMLKLNEMSLKEAAAVSGSSVASLKTATHRALQNLRKMLTDRSQS